MARLIDADEFMKEIRKWLGNETDFRSLQEIIVGMHTIEPVKHGKWITEGKHPFSPECSVCHKHGVQFAPVNYCPNCGARMDGE